VESTLTATGGTPGEGAVGGAGNSGTIDGPDTGSANITVTGGSVPSGITATVGSGNTGTITGGNGTNTITASLGQGTPGNAAGNASGATIDGNLPHNDENGDPVEGANATAATCTVNGPNNGTVKNCTTDIGV
jgi:hypothetical protein